MGWRVIRERNTIADGARVLPSVCCHGRRCVPHECVTRVSLRLTPQYNHAPCVHTAEDDAGS